MNCVSYLPMGRTGNAMFQAATAWAYAKKHGMQFSCPTNTSSDVWSPLVLKHLQHPEFNTGLPTVEIHETQHNYQHLPFEESFRNQNVKLVGYFQSEKYFAEYREEMLEAFAIPWELKADTCSIHARYGDYLEIQGKHIIVDNDYLERAMIEITKRTGISKFKVFSDNINLFKERHGNLYNFEYSTNNNEWDDLVEMSCCHSNINSSSTFSWWSAWLNRNPDKVIVTQLLWFQLGWCGLNVDDIIPDSWLKM